MKNYTGLRITNFQTFCLNFIIGVGIVHTGVYLMNIVHQVGIVNSVQLLLVGITAVLAIIIYARKIIQRKRTFFYSGSVEMT